MQIQLVLVSASCCVHSQPRTLPVFHMSRPWWKHVSVEGKWANQISFEGVVTIAICPLRH